MFFQDWPQWVETAVSLMVSLNYDEKRNKKAKCRQNKGKAVLLSDSHKAPHAALQMTVAISIVI